MLNSQRVSKNAFAFFTIIFLLVIPCAHTEITNIQVSNLTSTSAAISWLSSDSVDACIRYGLTTSLGDSANETTADYIHLIGLTGLEDDTTYYYEIRSGSEIDSNGGAYYTFHSSVTGSGVPYSWRRSGALRS